MKCPSVVPDPETSLMMTAVSKAASRKKSQSIQTILYPIALDPVVAKTFPNESALGDECPTSTRVRVIRPLSPVLPEELSLMKRVETLSLPRQLKSEIEIRKLLLVTKKQLMTFTPISIIVLSLPAP